MSATVGDSGPRRLAPCPRQPNCVSSLARRAAQRVRPLAFRGTGEEAMTLARRALESMSGCRLVESASGYLRAEFTSRIFRFVDDLELLLDEPARALQIRSSSRQGYWDLGANRRRVEALRRRFDRLQARS